MIPNVASWTHELPLLKHTLFLEIGGCVVLRFSFLKAGGTFSHLVAQHCRVHVHFQISPRLPHQLNATQSSTIIEFRLLVCPFLLLSLLSDFTNFGPYFRPHIVWSSGRLIFCQSPSDHIYLFEGFSFSKTNFVSPFQESEKLLFASTFQ